jgi:hypothetical protein
VSSARRNGIPSFSARDQTAVTLRFSRSAITAALRPSSAKRRSRLSSSGVQRGLAMRGCLVISPSPSARSCPFGGVVFQPGGLSGRGAPSAAGATSIDFRLLLDIGTYSGAFNLSADKKRNHSNRTKCAARHQNEKSLVGRRLSRSRLPRLAPLHFFAFTESPNSTRRRMASERPGASSCFAAHLSTAPRMS